MYRSDQRFKCLLKKKRFTIYYFSKNINDSVHGFLKNAVCIRSFNINHSITLSLLCPTVLRKYVNTFKARSQTFVNKHNPACEMRYCGMRYCGMRYVLFLLQLTLILFQEDFTWQEI